MKDWTAQQVQTAVWATVILSILVVIVISTIGIVLSVMFVTHDLEKIAPIDAKFLEILKEIMLISIGVISGVASIKITEK